jgi:hypothetical protein
MVRARKAIVTFAFGTAVIVACGGAQTGTTTTTSGTTNQPQCAHRGSTCVIDADCCSLWCANGVCATRQP